MTTLARSEELLARRCSDLEAVVEEQLAFAPALAPLAGLLERLRLLRRHADGSLGTLRDVLRCLRLLASLSSLFAMHERVSGSAPPPRRPAQRRRGPAVPWATAVALGALATASLAGALAGPRAAPRASLRPGAALSAPPPRGAFSACVAGDPHCIPGAGLSHAPSGGGASVAAMPGARGGSSAGAGPARGYSVDRSLVAAGVGALATQHPLLALALAVAMPAVLALGPQNAAEESCSNERDPAVSAPPPAASSLGLLLLHLGLPFSAPASGAPLEGLAPAAAAAALASELARAYDAALDALALRRHALAALVDSAESAACAASPGSPAPLAEEELWKRAKGGLGGSVEGNDALLLCAVDALLNEHGVGCAEDTCPPHRLHSALPSRRGYLSLLARASSDASARGSAESSGALPSPPSPVDEGFRAFALSPSSEVLARTRERVAQVAGSALLLSPTLAAVDVPAWFVQNAGCSICEDAWGAGEAVEVVVVAPALAPPSPSTPRSPPEPRATVCARRHGMCVRCAARILERQQRQRRELADEDAPPPPPSLAALAWEAVAGWGTELLWGEQPATTPPCAVLPGTPFACPSCNVPGVLQLLRFAS